MSQTIVKLNPGVQAPPVIQSNTQYLANGGQVIFNKSIELGGKSDVTFGDPNGAGYDFAYSGTGNVFNAGNGGNIRIKVYGFDFGKTATFVFDALTKIQIPAWSGPLLTYNGTPSTAVYYDVEVKRYKFGGITQPFQGTYEDNKTYHMVCIGMHFYDGICINDGTGQNIKFKGNSVYDLIVDGLDISGPTINQFDCGIVYVQGSASSRNIKRRGGWGYVKRLWIVKLGGIPHAQVCDMKNVVDVESTHYGTLDIRNDPAMQNSSAAIPLTGGDFVYQHVTSGNKKDDGAYVTNAVVLGEMKDDKGKIWPITIKDSFAFNAMASGQAGGSSLLKNNSNGTVTPIMSNNIDLTPGVPLPAGYVVDQIACIPVNPGPLIGKASDGTDIGGAQHIVVPPTPPKPRTVTKAQFWYDDGTVSFLP